MSETDSFIDEVNEEVRRDRLFGVLRRWGWLILLVILVIVGGSAWSEWRKAQQRADAERAGDALAAFFEAEEDAAQLEALSVLGSDDQGALLIAEFGKAAKFAAAERTEDAVQTLRAIAAREGLSQIHADLAQLKAAMLAPQDAATRGVLDALSAPGRPFRLLALEQRALFHANEGDLTAARADLGEILQDAGATREMQVRSQLMLTALGGEEPGRVEQDSDG